MSPPLPSFPLISKNKKHTFFSLSPSKYPDSHSNKKKKKEKELRAMTPPQIKILLLLFLVLFIHSPSCRVEGFKDGMKVTLHPIHEAAFIKLMKTRKLMAVNTVMDYDYAGPNPRHDPKKGKPGGGGGGGGKNNP